MKTKFEHVALHYVGSEIRVELKSKIFGSNECEVIFQGIDFSTAIVPHYRLVAYYPNLKDCTHSESLWLDGNYFKPLLRPINDITEEEESRFHSLEKSFEDRTHLAIELYAAMTAEYFKAGFDLFGLIENGEALDKTKL